MNVPLAAGYSEWYNTLLHKCNLSYVKTGHPGNPVSQGQCMTFVELSAHTKSSIYADNDINRLPATSVYEGIMPKCIHKELSATSPTEFISRATACLYYELLAAVNRTSNRWRQ